MALVHNGMTDTALHQRRKRASNQGVTISSQRLAEIEIQIQGLKAAAQTERSASELRYRVLMGARTIRRLIEGS
jgi:hypothetical protein